MLKFDSSYSYHTCSRIEYFETLKSEQDEVVLLGENKAYKVYGTGTIRSKVFDYHEFLLHTVKYIPTLKQNLLSISMFDDIEYCTRVEHGVLKISHGEVIIDKRFKIRDLCILEDYNVTVHSSSSTEYFHDNKKL